MCKVESSAAGSVLVRFDRIRKLAPAVVEWELLIPEQHDMHHVLRKTNARSSEQGSWTSSLDLCKIVVCDEAVQVLGLVLGKASFRGVVSL